MSDFVKPPKHALNNPKWRLSAPCPTAKGKYSNLSVDLWNNNPRFVVATNDPKYDGDKSNSYGRITAALEPPVFWMVLEALDQVIHAEGKKKIVFENKGKARDADFKAPPVNLTDLIVGKDDEGQVYMCVVNRAAEGWPVVKFVFGPSDQRFHHLIHGNGEPFSRAELSVIAAKAWRRGLSEVMGAVLDSRYVEPPKRDFGGQRGGGGGGYGGGRGNGGGGGYSGGGQTSSRPPSGGGDDFGGDLDF